LLRIVKLNQFTKNKILTGKNCFGQNVFGRNNRYYPWWKGQIKTILVFLFQMSFPFLAIFKLEMKSGQNKCQSNWTFLLWSFTSERNIFFQVYWVSSSISCLPKNVLNAFSFPLREKERLFSLHCRGKKCRHCTFFSTKTD